jgi:hypothetical protein
MLAEGLGEQRRVLPGGDRLPGQRPEQAHEQPVLVAGAAGDDRHPMEAAVGQRLGRDLGQHAVAEPVRLERLRMGEQLGHRHAPQAGQGRGRIGASQLRRHRGAERLHLRRRPPSVPGDRGQPGEDAAGRQVHQGEATLDDRPVEQARRPGRDQVGAGRQPSVGLAEHGHVAGVSPERGGVARHPPERRLLVLQAEGPRGLQPGVPEGAEDAQPVVDGHHHHVPDGGEPAGVEEAAGPDGAVAVDPHHHRPRLARAGGPGGGDVEA